MKNNDVVDVSSEREYEKPRRKKGRVKEKEGEKVIECFIRLTGHFNLLISDYLYFTHKPHLYCVRERERERRKNEKK